MTQLPARFGKAEAVRFSIEQRFTSPLHKVLGAYTDQALYPALTGFSKVGTPEVVSRTASGDRVELRLRLRFIGDLSPAVTAVVDPGKLSWVQHEVYDLDEGTATVTFEPDNYADRFTCTGGYTFEDDGAGGTIRRASGDLKIRVLLVGGQAEKAMVMGLTEHFAEEQPKVDAWITAQS